MFYSFLWNNKPDKIKRNTANQKLTNGGLDMLDVDKFDKSLKLTWIRRFFNSKYLDFKGSKPKILCRVMMGG